MLINGNLKPAIFPAIVFLALIGCGLPGMSGATERYAHGMGKHGMSHHGSKHLLGPNWRETLSDEQRAKLDALHVDFARQKLPLKAKLRELKVDLVLLVTSDKPDEAAIEKQLDELLKMKKKIKLKKLNYMVAQRKLLTPEQRVSFDMEKMHKVMHGRKH